MEPRFSLFLRMVCLKKSSATRLLFCEAAFNALKSQNRHRSRCMSTVYCESHQTCAARKANDCSVNYYENIVDSHCRFFLFCCCFWARSLAAPKCGRIIGSRSAQLHSSITHCSIVFAHPPINSSISICQATDS